VPSQQRQAQSRIRASRWLERLLAAGAICLSICRRQLRGKLLYSVRGVYYVPLWLPLLIALALLTSGLWREPAQGALHALAARLGGAQSTELAAFLAPSVRYWSRDIGRWAGEHGLDPQLLATVMQIESCGHPAVLSPAGAQGLFQVMPFHFAEGESMLDPATNAKRGAGFLKQCYSQAGGVIGLTLACYNGGASVIGKQPREWHRETQQYYRWGVGIYSDAASNTEESATYQQWLAAGGQGLCDRAEAELRL